MNKTLPQCTNVRKDLWFTLTLATWHFLNPSLLCVQARDLLQKGKELPASLVASILEEKLTSPEVQHYGRTPHWPITGHQTDSQHCVCQLVPYTVLSVPYILRPNTAFILYICT